MVAASAGQQTTRQRAAGPRSGVEGGDEFAGAGQVREIRDPPTPHSSRPRHPFPTRACVSDPPLTAGIGEPHGISYKTITVQEDTFSVAANQRAPWLSSDAAVSAVHEGECSSNSTPRQKITATACFRPCPSAMGARHHTPRRHVGGGLRVAAGGFPRSPPPRLQVACTGCPPRPPQRRRGPAAPLLAGDTAPPSGVIGRGSLLALVRLAPAASACWRRGPPPRRGAGASGHGLAARAAPPIGPLQTRHARAEGSPPPAPPSHPPIRAPALPPPPSMVPRGG